MTTLAELETNRAELVAARSKTLLAKVYGVSGRQIQRETLADLSKEIAKVDSKIYKRNNGGSASARVIFDRGGR